MLFLSLSLELNSLCPSLHRTYVYQTHCCHASLSLLSRYSHTFQYCRIYFSSILLVVVLTFKHFSIKLIPFKTYIRYCTVLYVYISILALSNQGQFHVYQTSALAIKRTSITLIRLRTDAFILRVSPECIAGKREGFQTGRYVDSCGRQAGRPGHTADF